MEIKALKSKLWQTLYAVNKEHEEKDLDTRVKILSSVLIPFGFNDETIRESIAREFITLITRVTLVDEEEEAAQLSLIDIERLKKIVVTLKLSREEASLLLTLTLYARKFYHPSGWIKYEKNELQYEAGLTKLKEEEWERVTRALYTNNLFSLQVVGSNSPIPCFKLSFLEEIDEKSNPLIDVGIFSPAGIAKILDLYILNS